MDTSTLVENHCFPIQKKEKQEKKVGKVGVGAENKGDYKWKPQQKRVISLNTSVIIIHVND